MHKALAWLLPVLTVAVVIWLMSGNSEEQRILDRLEQIRALAEVRDQEQPVAQLNRARQLGARFTPRTRYDLTTLGLGVTEIDSRETLTQRIAAARARLASLELEPVTTAVQVDGDRATVGVIGMAQGAVRGDEGRFMDVHRVEIELVRQDGDWLVSGGRHVRDERAAFDSE